MTDLISRIERRFKIMGGPALLVIDVDPTSNLKYEHILSEAGTLLTTLEARYSRYKPTSLISQINRRAGTGLYTEIDPVTQALLELAGQLWDATTGLFDATSGPLRRAWDFKCGGKALPEQIDSALALVGWDRINWDGNSLHLPCHGMEIDLGGLVKEYAVDCVTNLFREAGVLSGMIELGGDIAVIGPQATGAPWQIGIQNPNGLDSFCTVNLSDEAIATSGNYARTLEYQGREYGHLLNPRTGWPVTGAASVSVIDTSCVTAGAVATIGCLKTEEKAKEWLDISGLPWLMVGAQSGVCGTMKRVEPELQG